MACRLPSDPNFLLRMMEDMDSGSSDEEFDGYIDDNDEELIERRQKELEQVEDRLEEMNIDGSDGDGSEVQINDGDVQMNDSDNGSDGSSGGADFNSGADMSGKEPVDVFEKYFDDVIVDHILQETNRYGDQYVQNQQHHLDTHPHSRVHDFVRHKFDKGKIIQLLVLVITMGLVDMPSISNYWSTQWPLHSTNFNKILSRDRFILMLKFLHLADNSWLIPRGNPGYNKLFKIREFLRLLLTRFQTMFTLNREISINKTIIGYKG